MKLTKFFSLQRLCGALAVSGATHALIFSTISITSDSQCSDRPLEEFNSLGEKDVWLKRVRSIQDQAKKALRTGVWSNGRRLSKEDLEQVRDGTLLSAREI